MLKIKRTIALVLAITIIMAVCSITVGASYPLAALVEKKVSDYGTVCQVIGTLGWVTAGVDGYLKGDFVFAEQKHPSNKASTYEFYGLSPTKGTMYVI